MLRYYMKKEQKKHMQWMLVFASFIVGFSFGWIVYYLLGG